MVSMLLRDLPLRTQFKERLHHILGHDAGVTHLLALSVAQRRSKTDVVVVG